jgi:hypothetical protein
MIGICWGGVLLAGCEEEQAARKPEKSLDTELVNTLNNIQVENAIITQHTLYPYHFVTDGEGLNDLGQRDFAVLAKHFQEHPGVLNVRQGEASVKLYTARLAQVQSQLSAAGVDVSRMIISDGLPGGPGLPSEIITTTMPKAVASPTTMGTSSGSSSTGTITR